MEPLARLRTWMPRLLLFLVLAILLLVGVIQYQWFSRSAAVEIEGTIRGLEATLRQSVGREFQRYAPVVTELEALRTSTNKADAQRVLDRLLATYGPEGSVPGLVSWVGYESGGTFEKAVRPQTWEVAPAPTPGRDEPWDGGPENILALRLDPPGTAAVLGLDVEHFFSTYVLPALAEVVPGSQVTWTKEEREFPPPEAFDAQAYAFNPLKALTQGASLPPTLAVGIPRVIDLPSRNVLRESFPSLHLLSGWRVNVTLPSNSPVLAIEGRLAWNWLASSLLLVVLGGAFVLVIGQASRADALRRREREFVASVSHELRTPLTVIRSAADNFVQGVVPAERQGRYGSLILDQALRLGRMIEEILAFAQAEAGTTARRVSALLTFEPWWAEIQPPLEALAQSRGCALVWDIGGLPRAGRGDPEALRLVVDNLVVNSLNHAYRPPESGVDPRTRPVRVTLRHLVPDRLELIVDDDGRGISPKEARKVFDPFYRDEVSRNNQESGSGLGLFLAQRQARKMGGDLRLESPWRRLDGVKRPGCRFRMVVPFVPEDPEAPHVP